MQSIEILIVIDLTQCPAPGNKTRKSAIQENEGFLQQKKWRLVKKLNAPPIPIG
jgi:hypothetical protein